MKSLKKIFRITTLVGFVFAFGLVFANCRGHHSFEKRVEWVASKLTSKLDLDESQIAKLGTIKSEIIAKHKELKPKHMNWASEIAKQVRQEKIDSKVLDKMSSEKDVRHQEMRKFFHAKLVEFHAILKPEQREKFAELIEKFSKHHAPSSSED
ncbi:Spy/CpxP family protein refolding chaperone [Leptospira sp. 96542]|nr:Spy/CpxP family protein refolding chaperone [Leptospira sp. 96542]